MNELRAIVVSFLILAGAGFMLLSAIGLVRFPDFLTRMHAATKSASFGSVLMLFAAAFYFFDLRVFIEVSLIVVFIFLTAPLSAHMIGRAGFYLRIPLWEKTKPDHLLEEMDHY